MKEYNYHGYTIKQEHRTVGYGLTWMVYKNNKLIMADISEKVAKETVDWHIQYGEEN